MQYKCNSFFGKFIKKQLKELLLAVTFRQLPVIPKNWIVELIIIVIVEHMVACRK